jgi:hypothetical protein
MRFRVETLTRTSDASSRIEARGDGAATLVIDIHSQLLHVTPGDILELRLDDSLGYGCHGTVVAAQEQGMLVSCGGMLLLLLGAEEPLHLALGEAVTCSLALESPRAPSPAPVPAPTPALAPAMAPAPGTRPRARARGPRATGTARKRARAP